MQTVSIYTLLTRDYTQWAYGAKCRRVGIDTQSRRYDVSFAA